jgi:predicted dehydrogenase
MEKEIFMSQKTYRAAAIGYTGAGNYGHGLHLPFKELENVEFAAVADPDEVGRKATMEETGALRGYADYHEMLDKEELDIVSVGPRWTTERLDMVLACIEADCHIYCEKPMTATLADGDRIVNAAGQKGLKVAVAHQGVYLLAIQGVKKILNDGRIGTVQAIHAHGKQDRRGGGEDMIVLGTHLFNTMRYFVGDVKWMHAHVTENGKEVTRADARDATEPVGPVAGDCINSYFAFESGVSGFFDSRKDQVGSNHYSMELIGSDGRLSLHGGGGDGLVIYPYSCWTPADASQKWEPVQFDDMPFSSGNNLAILDLIDAIENDRKPTSSAEDAVAALEMILGTYESQLTGKRVPFPIENREHPLQR